MSGIQSSVFGRGMSSGSQIGSCNEKRMKFQVFLVGDFRDRNSRCSLLHNDPIQPLDGESNDNIPQPEGDHAGDHPVPSCNHLQYERRQEKRRGRHRQEPVSVGVFRIVSMVYWHPSLLFRSDERDSLFEKHMLRKLCRDEEASSGIKVNASWNKIQNFMVKVRASRWRR